MGATSMVGESPARKPGIKDVAKAAGVSVGTVSNVLNAPQRVSPEVQERVRAAIMTLGYVRNAAASTLRRGVSPLVGVVVLDITNPFFLEAAGAMEEAFDKEDLIMALSSSRADKERERRTLRTLNSQAVRGVILTPTDPELTTARELAAGGTPVILFDVASDDPQFSGISVDDTAGAATAVSHLIELGHKDILFINGPKGPHQSTDRLTGALRAVADHPGIGVRLTTIHADAFRGDAAARALLDYLTVVDTPPTGLFCAADVMAFGAMTTLHNLGLEVPGDVSIVGFDDIALSAQSSIPLTTIRQPMDEIGRRAAEMLINTPNQIVHERYVPTLQIRDSTAPPNAS